MTSITLASLAQLGPPKSLVLWTPINFFESCILCATNKITEYTLTGLTNMAGALKILHVVKVRFKRLFFAWILAFYRASLDTWSFELENFIAQFWSSRVFESTQMYHINSTRKTGFQNMNRVEYYVVFPTHVNNRASNFRILFQKFRTCFRVSKDLSKLN